MNALTKVATDVLKNNLFIEEHESIAIVTDDSLKEIAGIFYDASTSSGNEAVFIEMKTRSKSGEEPPHMVSEAMKASDVCICITEHSLTHTNARRDASANGTRVVTMPGVTLDMLQEGAISADYQKVEQLTKEYCVLLDEGEEVVLKKDDHTLTMSIKGRKAIPSTGIFREKGDSGNLPSGESYIAPLETDANGSIIVDGAIAGIGVLQEPIVLTVEDGRLIDASGKDGKKLLEILGDGDGRTIAELGIGTNKSARLTGNVLEDEKVYGTVHIAFGSNKSFGGQTDAGVHIDCVIKSPHIEIDGKVLEL